MADELAFRLMVLHDEEIRTAAKMLRAAFDGQHTPEFPVLALHALNACNAALHGCDDERAGLTIVSVPGRVQMRAKPEDPPQ